MLFSGHSVELTLLYELKTGFAMGSPSSNGIGFFFFILRLENLARHMHRELIRSPRGGSHCAMGYK